jgi:contractile injection system tube protein
MSSFPGSPKLVRGGLVTVDPGSGQPVRIITLQYNPDSLSRTLQVQGVSGEGGDRSEALRLKGPAVETIKLEAEIDAADQLEFPDQNPNAVAFGIQPQLAALETLVYPSTSDLIATNALASIGTIEIAPAETFLTLFVWGGQRVVPVRVTDFSITEEAFDPALNPIRAKVSLGLRVLSVDDLGFGHKGGSLFLGYLKNKEQLAGRVAAGTPGQLGLGAIP